MRSYSNTFAALLAGDNKRPRFVLQISFSSSAADDVYVKSHADVDLTAVTGTVLDARTQQISVLSQQMFPDDGRSTIGSFSFDAVDVAGSLTTAQRTALVTNAHGLRYRTVQLWIGFAEMMFADYQLHATQIVAESSLKENVYRFTCNDVQRQARQKIFAPVKLALAQPIDAVVTTIPINGDTAQIEALEHDAAFSDAPSAEVAYIKIDDEIIRIPVAGIVANQFTGCTRGVLGTVATEHDTETGLTADRQKAVDEVIYLEMNAVKLAYAILTGVLWNQSPAVMPSGWYAGVAPAFVDQTVWQAIGDDLYDGTDEDGVILRFLGLDSEDAKAFVEKQIMRVIGCFMPVQADGTLSLKRLARVLHGAAPVAEITDRDLVGAVGVTYSMKQIQNRIQVAWNAIDGDATRFLQLDDADSIAKWQASDVRVIEAFGLWGGIHSGDTVRRLLESYRDRYSGPPLLSTIRTKLALAALEPGDIVRLATATASDFTDPRSAGTLDRAVEIQSSQLDWMGLSCQFDVFGSTEAAGPLPRSATATAIPDAWFTSSGTNIVGLAGVTGAGPYHMTGNLTFAGGASNRSSGSIWYCNGDLIIDAGVILSITGNVQLRIKGVLTINGSIRGIGGGLAGVADTLVATAWPYFDPNDRTPYEGVSVQLGQVGYYGSPRAGGGLREAIRNENSGTASFIDSQSFACPATTNGVDIVPTLQIDFDGSIVAGIPADLRGCSGGPGGKYHFSQTHNTNFQVIRDGGDGGASGAGLLVVSRGSAFGASGFINLSGLDGTVGDHTYAQDWIGGAVNLIWAGCAGAGAGGAPGAYVCVVDGVLNPLPVLTNSTFIANYGLSPLRVTPSPPAPFSPVTAAWFSGKVDFPGGPRPISARSYYDSPTSGLVAGLAACRALFLAAADTPGEDVPPGGPASALSNIMPAGLADFERVASQAVHASPTGTAVISTARQWFGLKSLLITPTAGTGEFINIEFANATAWQNIPMRPGRRHLFIFSVYIPHADARGDAISVLMNGASAIGTSQAGLTDWASLPVGEWSRIAYEVISPAGELNVAMQLHWENSATTATPAFNIDGVELLDVTGRPDLTVDHFPGDFIPAGGSTTGGIAFDGGAQVLGTYATPEAAVTAIKGSTAYDQTNGAAYLKETGTGNTGWSRMATRAYADTGDAAAEAYADAGDAAVAALIPSVLAPIVKSADQNSTSTTLADDSALQFAVDANGTYGFDMLIRIVSGAAADFKFDFSGPASPTFFGGQFVTYNTGGVEGGNITFANLSTTVTISTNAGEVMMRLSGIFVNGANAGTLKFRWAQNAASGTTTVKKGSWLQRLK